MCDDPPEFCAVFSDNDDCSSISKIFSATRSCMAQCSVMPQTHQVVQNIMLALLKVEDFLPREKFSVFFSLLLRSCSGIALGNISNDLDRDLICFLDSFSGQICAVISDVEASSMFVESFQLDELPKVIEDFLIDRRVLVCCGVSSKAMLPHDSKINILLNGDIMLSTQMASGHQLIAGCIILASICTAVDRIGFICETSYSILRMQKIDFALMLTILHVFAHLCGSKYVTVDDYHLMMTVMKSLVTFIETTNFPVNTDPSLPSLTEALSVFCACAKCPFSEGAAISMDDVVFLLLEKLQSCASYCTLYKDPIGTVKSLNSEELSHKDKSEQNSSWDEAFYDRCMDCNVFSFFNQVWDAYYSVKHLDGIGHLAMLYVSYWRCWNLVPWRIFRLLLLSFLVNWGGLEFQLMDMKILECRI